MYVMLRQTQHRYKHGNRPRHKHTRTSILYSHILVSNLFCSIPEFIAKRAQHLQNYIKTIIQHREMRIWYETLILFQNWN